MKLFGYTISKDSAVDRLRKENETLKAQVRKLKEQLSKEVAEELIKRQAYRFIKIDTHFQALNARLDKFEEFIK